MPRGCRGAQHAQARGTQPFNRAMFVHAAGNCSSSSSMSGYRDAAGGQLMFLACGCPVTQGCECFLYARGMSPCLGVLLGCRIGCCTHLHSSALTPSHLSPTNYCRVRHVRTVPTQHRGRRDDGEARHGTLQVCHGVQSHPHWRVCLCLPTLPPAPSTAGERPAITINSSVRCNRRQQQRPRDSDAAPLPSCQRSG